MRNLAIFKDETCDYVLNWIVVDKNEVDNTYVAYWNEFFEKNPNRKFNIFDGPKAYMHVATFFDRKDAERFVQTEREIADKIQNDIENSKRICRKIEKASNKTAGSQMKFV